MEVEGAAAVAAVRVRAAAVVVRARAAEVPDLVEAQITAADRGHRREALRPCRDRPPPIDRVAARPGLTGVAVVPQPATCRVPAGRHRAQLARAAETLLGTAQALETSPEIGRVAEMSPGIARAVATSPGIGRAAEIWPTIGPMPASGPMSAIGPTKANWITFSIFRALERALAVDRGPAPATQARSPAGARRRRRGRVSPRSALGWRRTAPRQRRQSTRRRQPTGHRQPTGDR